MAGHLFYVFVAVLFLGLGVLITAGLFVLWRWMDDGPTGDPIDREWEALNRRARR